MTAVLPETIDHLDFDHEQGCQHRWYDCDPCGATPVTHRLILPCRRHVYLLCTDHARGFVEQIQGRPFLRVVCPCGGPSVFRDMSVVPL